MGMESQICWIFGTTWPCLTPSEWAAWAQAVGTFVALLIAFGVPYWQSWKQDREAARERIIERYFMSQALQQPIEGLLVAAKLGLRMMEMPENAAVVATIPDEPFSRTPEFDQFRTRLFLLGRTGSEITALVGWIVILNKQSVALRDNHGTLPADIEKKLKDTLTLARDTAESAKQGLIAIERAMAKKIPSVATE